MVIFYKKWKKYNEIKFTKKNNFNNRKITNYPPGVQYSTIVLNTGHSTVCFTTVDI